MVSAKKRTDRRRGTSTRGMSGMSKMKRSGSLSLAPFFVVVSFRKGVLKCLEGLYEPFGERKGPHGALIDIEKGVPLPFAACSSAKINPLDVEQTRALHTVILEPKACREHPS